jgi:hypothetical protein
MNEFFFAALSFGLAAGLKPGPLGIIVIQQTLSKGLRAGVRASLAPLITDGPIIIWQENYTPMTPSSQPSKSTYSIRAHMCSGLRLVEATS